MNHDSVGVVGLAAGNQPDEIKKFVSRATGELVSRLITLIDGLEKSKKDLEGKFKRELTELEFIVNAEQWEDFRCYVAHLWNEKKVLRKIV